MFESLGTHQNIRAVAERFTQHAQTVWSPDTVSSTLTGPTRVLFLMLFLLSNFQKPVYHKFRFMLFTLTTRCAMLANQPAGQGTHVIMGSG